VNRGGSITEEVTLILSYQGHKEHAVFKVCNLGKSNLIIGYTWLHKHNLEINWETGKVEMTRCPRECNIAERRQKCKGNLMVRHNAQILARGIQSILDKYNIVEGCIPCQGDPKRKL